MWRIAGDVNFIVQVHNIPLMVNPKYTYLIYPILGEHTEQIKWSNTKGI